MTRFNPGDRVEHDYHGTGTVIEKVKRFPLHRVLWDKRPDVRYNMGENPCSAWTAELRKVASDVPESGNAGRG